MPNDLTLVHTSWNTLDYKEKQLLKSIHVFMYTTAKCLKTEITLEMFILLSQIINMFSIYDIMMM